MARREEWQEQVKLALLLDKWLDPACAFWTATDPVAPSITSGAMRKRRGVKPAYRTYWFGYRGRSITVELNSGRGQCSRSQRLTRERLQRAGVQWWVCRSANAAMWVLAKSGVRFRTLVNDAGTRECWQQPKLPAWEVPKRDPQERRPHALEWDPEGLKAEIVGRSAGHKEQTERAMTSAYQIGTEIKGRGSLGLHEHVADYLRLARHCVPR